MIIFSSVQFLSKKIIKPKLKKKNRNRTEPVQTDWFRFGFLGQNRFGLVLARFFRFCSVFSVWVGFGLVFFPIFFGLGSVWCFRFQAYKTETEPVGFFKILIGFFSRFCFSGFFFGFLNFLVFITTRVLILLRYRT